MSSQAKYFTIHVNDAGTDAYNDAYVHDLEAEVERLHRDYSLLEECSPPDVPRTTFVQMCFDAWEKQASAQDVHAEVEQLRGFIQAEYDQYNTRHPFAHELRNLYPWLAADAAGEDDVHPNVS